MSLLLGKLGLCVTGETVVSAQSEANRAAISVQFKRSLQNRIPDGAWIEKAAGER